VGQDVILQRGCQPRSSVATQISRRALFIWSTGFFFTACTRKRAPRYQGWLFVAGGAGKEIAVADLATFRRISTIPLPCSPDQLFWSEDRVYVLCREARTILEIDAGNFRVAARTALPGKPVAARLLADKTAVAVCADQDALIRVDLAGRRVVARRALPGPPADVDVNDTVAAITVPSKNLILRAALPDLRIAGATDTGAPCTAVRFRRDGKTILAGALTAREIVALDAQYGNLLARLPLPVVPSRFCFNPDGGQMFVTGSGADVVAIVSPFQNEVAETILAGHTPWGMAVSNRNNMLFVTNRDSGDLTVLDIQTRDVWTSVHVGESPGDVLLTPGDEYVLVLDQRSGNVSVVRMTTILNRKNRTSSPPSPLFTVFPTATDARSAVVVPYPRV
jgi:YVTN family beta-propeller protein